MCDCQRATKQHKGVCPFISIIKDQTAKAGSLGIKCVSLLDINIDSFSSAKLYQQCISRPPVVMKSRDPNRSFNIPPPGQPPGHLNFWKISFQIRPSPGQKGDQMPPPLRKLLNNLAQRISSFTGTWMKESRLRRLQSLNKI